MTETLLKNPDHYWHWMGCVPAMLIRTCATANSVQIISFEADDPDRLVMFLGVSFTQHWKASLKDHSNFQCWCGMGSLMPCKTDRGNSFDLIAQTTLKLLQRITNLFPSDCMPSESVLVTWVSLLLSMISHLDEKASHSWKELSK